MIDLGVGQIEEWEDKTPILGVNELAVSRWINGTAILSVSKKGEEHTKEQTVVLDPVQRAELIEFLKEGL